MLHRIASLTSTLRCRMRRRAVERELLELVARLPQEPERRSTYQRLVEEHTRLAAGDDSGDGQDDFDQRPAQRAA